MASTLTLINSICIFCFTLFSTFFITINSENFNQFSETTFLNRMEKVSHLHFYFHDIHSGRNPTAEKIAGPANITAIGFGTTWIMDDPLTEGPEPTSKIVGRAQGIYAFAAQQELSLLMVLNLAFMEGKYNGSALSVLGRNPVLHTVREMPIVGGSGLFRFARGYALAKTIWFNNKGDAIVEYNVSVIHY